MSTKLALTSGGGVLFPEDVFSSYAYTGNASARNIQNGVNLSAYGGMVWTKARGTTGEHLLCDTTRGANLMLSTTTGYSGGSTTYANSVTAFNSDGYSLGTSGTTNGNTTTMASWTFRKARRFFDIVTYTGNLGSQTVNHSLGVAPGFIMVKRTDALGNFFAYHRSAGASGVFDVNAGTGLGSSTTAWGNTAPTASSFFLGANSSTNASGASYIAYLFAHDTAADGVIQCGTYTGGGVGAGPTVTLGWEPQFILFRSGANADWAIADVLRGMQYQYFGYYLYPNTTAAEFEGSTQARVTPTGFRMLAGGSEFNVASTTYYYVAIRKPEKSPTSGTQVFSPEIHTSPGLGVASTITTGFPVDLYVTGIRNVGTRTKMHFISRQRGGVTQEIGLYTSTNSITASGITATVKFDSSTSVVVTDSSANLNGNSGSELVLDYSFRRAKGFFDVVPYTGTGSTQSVPHNLGVVPEFMIVKTGSSTDGAVYVSSLGASQRLALFAFTAGPSQASNDSTVWNATSPTASAFTVGASGYVNANGESLNAWLFASLAGVSKVGSYTGNGSSQTINCGFAAGARFILIKRTDASGDWYIWDTARGIVASNDPYLVLNSNAAEVSSDDSIDPANSGFIVNQTATTNINVTSGNYIYLAIA
jgi:hypothetical protein